MPTHFSWLESVAIDAGLTEKNDFIEIVNNALLSQTSVIDKVISSGLIKEDDFCEGVASFFQVAWIADALILEDEEEDSITSRKGKFGADLAVQFQVFPLEIESDHAVLVCYDPINTQARQTISRRLNMSIEWCMASRRRVQEAISRMYGVGAGTFETIIDGREDNDLDDVDKANIIDDDLEEEASVLKFVNNIMREALSQKATDIHFEPHGEVLKIRYRIDGELVEVPIPDHIHKLEAAVIARLKIMAHLDVSEKRKPQDGRIHLNHEGKSIDVRVATIPSVEGETVSLRLLNQDRFNLDKLAMEDEVRGKVEALLELSNGVILATGPTGSGKSTSLYSFLDSLNVPGTRIVTVEDPVENKLPGVVQIAVKPEVGLTFAAGLRSILRADPNIVMVGEIRDSETAEIAVRASLTGHLVFSTLHTNSAIGAVSRLVDMGVEPYLVSASVRGLLAQRLVRKLCPHCKKPVNVREDLPGDFTSELGSFSGTIYEANGCHECRYTGYSGRIALYEICILSAKIQELIAKGASEQELRDQAVSEGFQDMRVYGLEKVKQGVTTMEEVLSVTQNNLVS